MKKDLLSSLLITLGLVGFSLSSYGQTVLTGSGNYTIPSNVTSIKVELVGPGG